jgi:hypothetical protein
LIDERTNDGTPKTKAFGPARIVAQLFQERVWWVTFPKIGLTSTPRENYGIDVAAGEEFR